MRSSILTLIKKYFTDIDEEYDDDRILNAIGIAKTTSELHLKGNIQFKLGDSLINIADFKYGVALNSQTIRELQLNDYHFSKVISVENKANFNYLCTKEENSLILFSGGFYTPAQKRFLNTLYKLLLEKDSNIGFYHWGDLDLGGFNIYRNIKNNIFYKLEPYMMNIDVIKNQTDYCEVIKELHELIRFITENKITLEQESIII